MKCLAGSELAARAEDDAVGPMALDLEASDTLPCLKGENGPLAPLSSALRLGCVENFEAPAVDLDKVVLSESMLSCAALLRSGVAIGNLVAVLEAVIALVRQSCPAAEDTLDSVGQWIVAVVESIKLGLNSELECEVFQLSPNLTAFWL